MNWHSVWLSFLLFSCPRQFQNWWPFGALLYNKWKDVNPVKEGWISLYTHCINGTCSWHRFPFYLIECCNIRLNVWSKRFTRPLDCGYCGIKNRGLRHNPLSNSLVKSSVILVSLSQVSQLLYLEFLSLWIFEAMYHTLF